MTPLVLLLTGGAIGAVLASDVSCGLDCGIRRLAPGQSYTIALNRGGQICLCTWTFSLLLDNDAKSQIEVKKVKMEGLEGFLDISDVSTDDHLATLSSCGSKASGSNCATSVMTSKGKVRIDLASLASTSPNVVYNVIAVESSKLPTPPSFQPQPCGGTVALNGGTDSIHFTNSPALTGNIICLWTVNVKDGNGVSLQTSKYSDWSSSTNLVLFKNTYDGSAIDYVDAGSCLGNPCQRTLVWGSATIMMQSISPSSSFEFNFAVKSVALPSTTTTIAPPTTKTTTIASTTKSTTRSTTQKTKHVTTTTPTEMPQTSTPAKTTVHHTSQSTSVHQTSAYTSSVLPTTTTNTGWTLRTCGWQSLLLYFILSALINISF